MHNDLHRLETQMIAALQGLDARQTQAVPLAYPEKWSIQRIIEHLLMTYRSSSAAIQARVDKGSATRATPSLGQRFVQFLIISLGRFPPGRKAPAAVIPGLPSTVRSGEELGAAVKLELDRFDAITAKGEVLFGSRRAVSHISLGPLSMRQWRRFHLIHGLHHVKQIRAIRKDHAI